MARFGAVLTAMVTPFKDDLSVDFDRAAELAKHLIDTGSDGLVVTGTTGESPTLTSDEKLKLYEVTKQAVGAAPIIAGTGSNSTAQTLKLSRAVDRLPIAGLMIVTPYYNKPTQEGMFRHHRHIHPAEGAGTERALGHHPRRSRGIARGGNERARQGSNVRRRVQRLQAR